MYGVYIYIYSCWLFQQLDMGNVSRIMFPNIIQISRSDVDTTQASGLTLHDRHCLPRDLGRDRGRRSRFWLSAGTLATALADPGGLFEFFLWDEHRGAGANDCWHQVNSKVLLVFDVFWFSRVFFSWFKLHDRIYVVGCLMHDFSHSWGCSNPEKIEQWHWSQFILAYYI